MTQATLTKKSMFKVLVCDDLAEEGLTLFRAQKDFEVLIKTKQPLEELKKLISDADACVVRSGTQITKEVIAAAKQLKVIGRAGVGLDNVDLEAASKRGIVVINTPGGNTISAAELTFALLLALARRVPAADRAGPQDLSKIFFTSPQGRQVPLSDLARVESRVAPKPISHKDQYPVVYVSGELGSSSQVYAVLKMWSYLRNHELPGGVKLTQYFMADPETATAPTHKKGRTSEASRASDSARGPRLDPIGDTLGYSLRWDGEMRLTLDVFRDLGAAFLVALVLIYLVLVGYYRSFATPMIVMGAIPLTLIGVLPGHAILGQYFTATSMIGVIALAGIVVRNSLLLIDFILDFRREGHELREAVIQAGATRMRPILLTAFAIILGTFIMVFDPVFGGLAVSLIFGTFASTVLTLFVIPLVYYLYEQRQHHEQ